MHTAIRCHTFNNAFLGWLSPFTHHRGQGSLAKTQVTYPCCLACDNRIRPGLEVLRRCIHTILSAFVSLSFASLLTPHRSHATRCHLLRDDRTSSINALPGLDDAGDGNKVTSHGKGSEGMRGRRSTTHAYSFPSTSVLTHERPLC